MPLPPYLLERLRKRKVLVVEEKSETCSAGLANKTKVQPPNQGHSSGQSSYGNDHTNKLVGQEDQDEEIIAEDYSDSGDEKDQIEKASEQSSESDDDGCGSDDDVEDNNDNDGAKNNESQPLNGRLKTDDDHHYDEDAPPRSNLNQNNAHEKVDTQTETSALKDSVLGCPHKYNIYHDCTQYCLEKHGQPESLEPNLEQRKQLALLLRTFPMTNDWSVVYDPGVKTFYFWNIISNQVSWLPPGMSTFTSPSADQIRRMLS